MIKTSLLAFPVLMLLAAPVRADCNYPTFDFFPEKNGGVVVDMKVAISATGRGAIRARIVPVLTRDYA